jgi:hypothetical protein
MKIIQEIRKQPNIYLIKVNYEFLLLKLSSHQLHDPNSEEFYRLTSFSSIKIVRSVNKLILFNVTF